MALAEFRTSGDLMEHYRTLKLRMQSLRPPTPSAPPQPVRQEIIAVGSDNPLPPMSSVANSFAPRFLPVRRYPPIREIQLAVAGMYGVGVVDLCSNRRTRLEATTHQNNLSSKICKP